jgi:hypothetical protein
VSRRRSLVAVTALSLSVLTACGASAPPGKELADEMIETLEVSDTVKECMHEAAADFQIAPDSGFESFDDMAQKAADEQPQAVAVLAEFEAALDDCNR